FAASLVAGLRDLAGLARRDEPSLPRRWAVGSILVLFVAGPLWNLCVVHIQEPISGSDAVRIVFDNVLYGLVFTLALPLALVAPVVSAPPATAPPPRPGTRAEVETSAAPDGGRIPVFRGVTSHQRPPRVSCVARRQCLVWGEGSCVLVLPR